MIVMAENKRKTGRQATAPGHRLAANPRPPDEVFADGVASVLARPGLVKLECYRVMRIDREDNAEVRCVTHRLVLPSGAVPDLLRMLTDLTRAAGRSKGGKAG
jgi:hypothetical protein